MSDKHKHKDKDKKRKDGKEQQKETKRARHDEKEIHKEVGREDGNISDSGKVDKKKKKKNKEDSKEHKSKIRDAGKQEQPDRDSANQHKEQQHDQAPDEEAGNKPDHTQQEGQAGKRLKAWQDDELEIDSDEDAKVPPSKLHTLADVTTRGTGGASSSSSAKLPTCGSLGSDAQSGSAVSVHATRGKDDEEQDTLDAFMADLAKAKLEDKVGSNAAAVHQESMMGVMDSTGVKSITLEEIEALVGNCAIPVAGSPSDACEVAAVAASPNVTDGISADAEARTQLGGALSSNARRESEDDAFHAAFLAEVKRFRGEGGAGSNSPDEVVGPSFQPETSFKGARTGFVFKKGPFGLGYYKDVARSASATPAAMLDRRIGSTLDTPSEAQPLGENAMADASSSSDSESVQEDGRHINEEDDEEATPQEPKRDQQLQGLPIHRDCVRSAASKEVSVPMESSGQTGVELEVKVVETKKDKRRKRKEAKLAVAKVKASEEKRKAKEGFGGEIDQLMESDPDMSEQSSEEQQESYFDLVKRFTTKKSLPAVDHAKIHYSPFRKNLYIQVKEITNMKDHEVDDLRRTQGDIKVRGKHCPRPIKSFLQCGLPERMLKIFERRDYEQPFPIQMQAIPALMCGRDIIGVAQTGSGKTLAYLLPAIRHIMDQPPLKDGDGPIAFIVAPTRELALQIQREANLFCKAVGFTSVCAYGGGPMGEQLSALKKGAECLVGTPGRLIDVLTTSGGKITNLRRVTFLVLDEADRMFDMGFEPQIGMFLQGTRPDKQVAMFSATLPTHLEALCRQVLKKPLEITVGERNTAATNVTQFVEVLEESQKFYRLLQLLGEWHEHGSIIVFVHQQKDVDEMFTELLKYGYPALALHGGQDQHDRDFTLQDFKDGVANVLVATSVAARGIDVKQVILVVNFKVPDHLEDYIHRIGRTGRAGKHGFAYTFVQPDEAENAQDMVDALRQCGQDVPEKLKRLAEEHQSQVNTGQAKKKRRWGGFGGKGFKYDSTEKSQQQKDREKAKSDLLVGDPHQRQEEDESFRDPWNEDKPLSKKAQEQKKKDDERPAGPKTPSTTADPSATVAAAAAVAAKMQAAAAKAAPKASPVPGVGTTPADFIPAVTFTGAKPGMSFKTGPRGLGYYLDSEAPGVPVAATGSNTDGAATNAQRPPPPSDTSAASGPKLGALRPRRTDQELEEEARRKAMETLKHCPEDKLEQQLPALTAKLKERLRKQAREEEEEEESARAASAQPPPPPPPQPKAPDPKSPLLMALPLVPGVLGVGAAPEPNMVVRSMEQIQDKANRTVEATAQEAKDMAALLAGGGPIAPAGTHMDELEINDYPQIARQKVSHREPLLAIEELTGAKCWVKGQYFADERKMPEGARKLYVEITGPTSIAVQKAKHEVRKMMEALAIRTLNIPGVSRAVMGTPGRYDPAVGM